MSFAVNFVKYLRTTFSQNSLPATAPLFHLGFVIFSNKIQMKRIF